LVIWFFDHFFRVQGGVLLATKNMPPDLRQAWIMAQYEHLFIYDVIACMYIAIGFIPFSFRWRSVP
jgi:hypothetical protein